MLALSLLVWLILMITLIFWLNKHNQEGDLWGGNLWRKVYRKSQAFVDTIDDAQEKRSVHMRLRLIKNSQKAILFSIVGIVVAIVLWQFV